MSTEKDWNQDQILKLIDLVTAAALFPVTTLVNR